MTTSVHAPARRRIAPGLLAAVLAATWLAAAAGASPVRAGEVVIVDVADFAYSPSTITIQVGDTIQWNNADAVDHTATSVGGTPAAFDVYLAAGAWGSYTFEVAGTYDYFCIPHPSMTGRIIVEPAPAQASAPPAGGGGTDVPDVAMPPAADGPLLALMGLLFLFGVLGAATASVLAGRRA